MFHPYNSFPNYKKKTRLLVKAVISTCMALELLLVQLAIANPALHEWMHGESQCSHESAPATSCDDSASNEDELGHVCAVTILADVLTATTIFSVTASVETIDFIEYKQAQIMPRISTRSNPARGPPIQA